MERIHIPEEIVVKALWFSCAASSQTYERTERSKESAETHLWRIFSGKVGELLFLKYIGDHLKVDLEEHERRSLSIFWGKENVDSCDLEIAGKLIDIKTLPEPHHRFLIVPEDQYNNQPKEYYVCVRLIHRLSFQDKRRLFKRTCVDIYTLFQNPDRAVIPTLKGEILGFISHSSYKWKRVRDRDGICPEKPCYRVGVNELEVIEGLIRRLRMENSRT